MYSDSENSSIKSPENTESKSDTRIDLLDLARAKHQEGEYVAAQQIYKQILAINPLNTNALLGAGKLAQTLQKFDIANVFFSKVIEIEQQNYYAYFERGRTLSFQRNFQGAVANFTKALGLDPSHVQALNSRGIAYSHLSEFNAALIDFSRAIDINPNSADAFYNRALAYRKLEKFEFAVQDYSKAILINPQHYQAFNNRGMAYKELGKFGEAIADFGHSIAIKPDFADGYWNKALSHLMIEDYENTWELFEYRWLSANFTSPKRNFKQPLWLGKESLAGKKILLHSEQGFGDSIQFCRYITKFDAENCTIFLEVEKPLLRIMQTLLPKNQIFEKGTNLPKFDYHCPLMSLPLAFKTTIKNIPCQTPYLAAYPERVLWWKKYLGQKTKPRIGIAWQGNPAHSRDRKRSISLPEIIHYLSEDFDWYSLQLNISDEDQQIITKTKRINHFGELIGDFSETSAFCSVLDAVVSVDTSIAHLAGAIGRPVFLLLSYVADARWHNRRHDTPWYPNTKIFRQNSDRDWDKPIRNLLSSLYFNKF